MQWLALLPSKQMIRVRFQLRAYRKQSKEKRYEKDKTKTESTKTNYYPSVAKWYGSGLLTRISQVRILFDGSARFV